MTPYTPQHGSDSACHRGVTTPAGRSRSLSNVPDPFANAEGRVCAILLCTPATSETVRRGVCLKNTGSKNRTHGVYSRVVSPEDQRRGRQQTMPLSGSQTRTRPITIQRARHTRREEQRACTTRPWAAKPFISASKVQSTPALTLPVNRWLGVSPKDAVRTRCDDRTPRGDSSALFSTTRDEKTLRM